MKTSELIVLTDYEMESIQGGLTAARAPTRRPLFRLILLLLSAILGRSVPTPGTRTLRHRIELLVASGWRRVGSPGVTTAAGASFLCRPIVDAAGLAIREP